MLGNAAGQVFAPGVGGLRDIINNLRAIQAHYEENKGEEVTGLLGLFCTLFGMTELKKEQAAKKLVCTLM